VRVPERPLALVLACLSVLLFYGLAYEDFEALFGSLDFNGPSVFEDFTGPYMQTGAEVLTTGQPAPGFYYPPFFAILLAALPADSGGVSVWIWFAVQIFAAAAVIVLPFLVLRRPSFQATGLYLVAALSSFPLLHNFHWGQVSTILVALILAALLAYQRGMRHTAALLFALAISIKVYPLLFLPIFVVVRDLRFVLQVVLWSLFCSFAVPFAALGVPETFEFFADAYYGIERAQENLWVNSPGKQFLPVVVLRWLGSPEATNAAALALNGLGWAIYSGALFVIHKRRETGPGAVTWGFVLVFLCLPALLPTSWAHYFVYLPFCQLFLLVELFDGRRMGNIMWGLGVLLILASMFVASMFLFRLIADHEAYALHGWLLAADVVLFVVAWASSLGDEGEVATSL